MEEARGYGGIVVGSVFNDLEFFGPASNDANGKARATFRCVCGNFTVAYLDNVRRGHTKSCGCRLIRMRGKACITHGHTRGGNSRTYDAWRNMLSRCCKPQNKNYCRYGGRGILVCQRWLDAFENFLADMGECPAGLMLGRVDNDGNYEPSNCRWETRKQQNRNTSATQRITWNGETLSEPDWCDRIGVKVKTIACRLSRGWSIEEAMSPTADPYQSVDDITHDGRTQSPAEWAKELGLAKSTVYRRLKRGLPVEEVLRVAGPG